jgi:hypothetical protein
VTFLKVKKFKKNIVNWLKRIATNNANNNADLVNKRNNPHCPNFSSHCCLNCDKCWKKKD